MQNTLGILNSLNYMQEITRKKTKRFRLFKLSNIVFLFFEYVLYFMGLSTLYIWKNQEYMKYNNYLYLFGTIMFILTILLIHYDMFRLKSPYGWVEEIIIAVKVVFFTFMLSIGILFFLKTSVLYSRVLLFIFSLVVLFTIIAIRWAKRWYIRLLSKKGLYVKNILIIGAGNIGEKLLNELNNNKYFGNKVIGFLDDNIEKKGVLGKTSDIEPIISFYNIDEIIITIPSEKKLVNAILNNIRKFRVKVKVVPEVYDLVTSKVAFHQLERYPFIEYSENKLSFFHVFLKRAIDLFSSILGMVLLAPLFLVLFILVKMDSEGSAIFKQNRIGKDGKLFHIYKFRSMISGAEERLKSEPILYKKYIENNYKLEPDEDPRITSLGRFLRKTSLDEIPQLLNVFKGDMSLVGPRPIVEDELKEYEDRVADFLSVKPGVTGYWQVSGRSSIGYPERVNVELYYVYNQSITLDIKIILKTVITVFRRDGAY